MTDPNADLSKIRLKQTNLANPEEPGSAAAPSVVQLAPTTLPRQSEETTGAAQTAVEQACVPAAVPSADEQPDKKVKGNTRKFAGRKSKVSVSLFGQPPTEIIHPVAGAKLQQRHRWLIVSFAVIVLLPVTISAWYLFVVAKDQYASRLAFFVRSEEAGSPVDLLGGLTALSGNSGSDTDVLFEFIQSQELVRLIDQRLDLRSIYYASDDPVFSVNPDVPIEELADYWNKMVRVYYDASSGLIEIRVVAFDAETAVLVANSIYEESSEMINRLSAIAREDAISYARAGLELAVSRLRDARQAISDFRLRTQIVDPQADILGRMGVLNELQAQLANAQIELDILNQTIRANDPRISRAIQRVNVIQGRITEERDRFSAVQGPDHRAYANLVGEFEGLSVDKEFAEATYFQALAAYELAQAEALRKTRYLAAYVNPTKAESSQFPQRFVLLAILMAFLFGGWSVVSLICYSVRDRRQVWL